MRILTILLLFGHQIALGNEQTDTHIFDELEAIKDQRIKKIIEARKSTDKRRYTDTELFTLKVTLEDITKSELETAIIEKGAKLISLSGGNTKYTPKRLTVKAYAKADRNGYKYIVNKNNVPKYMVSLDNISNVTEITNLYREPKKFLRLEKELPAIQYDDQFRYSLLVNFHLGLSLTQFTKSIIKDADDFAPLARIEIGSNTNFDIPIDTGLSLVYEQVSGNLENGAGSFSARALSLGPNFIKKEIFGAYDLILQTRLAILSDLTERRSGDTTNYNLSDTSLLLAIEKDFKLSDIGNFTLGYSFQRKWLKPKAKTSGLDLSLNAKSDDSFGLYIGHGTDLLW